MTRARRRRIIRTRRTLTGLALVGLISFLAGMTDATGLLLTGDFVSFMTGNTTRAALALSDGNLFHAAVLISAILVFVLGNAAGIVIAHVSERRIFVVLGCVGLVLALASIISTQSMLLPRFYLIVFSMGMVNAAVEHIEGLPIGLTYVTGALSRFGRGIGRWIIGDHRVEWTIQIVPWGGMVAGAIAGAVLTRLTGAHALWLVSIFAMALALAAMYIPRPLQRRFNQKLAPHHSGVARGK
ncbi:YoaK family protein [Rhizobium sp. MC63]|uniref:YoaK family protein n=1 Tax=Rhizobium mulingense TaxID=3031128 RepID=A0ACC6N1E1_9HYPH|nr:MULTISPECIES: YoaK family protein [unclassified Rhizobium]MDF0695845.1 YoaK family protein [Rhizobium sp. MC63]MEA3519463.1 YoaK family protein [Rhizobium sp. MJ31]MEB3043330.1 YoaK family protein [Rhizobium sp. MJ21]